MQIEISFVVGATEVPSHHTDRRFSKVFDVEWPGRPMPGEAIDVDVGPPVESHDFKVAGVYWLTEGPSNVYLERIVIPPDEVEWQEGLDGYIGYCRKKGWKVTP